MKNIPSPTIRRAQVSDAEPISQLIAENTQQVAANGYTEAQKEAWILANTPQMVHQQLLERQMFCAIASDTIVGVIGLEGPKVVGLYVHPRALGQGIGRTLLKHLESCAKASGIDELYLYATPAGRPFYRKNGYSVGLQEDVLIDGVVFSETKMHKTLI